jgi:preprotein translocase subunit SecG
MFTSILVGLLTFAMVLDCIVLIFLVLIQLPKKEAGAGLAFGGGATDALFGAGSGNVLTKITKWAAGIFFGLAIFLAVLQSHRSTSQTPFQKGLSQPTRQSAPTAGTAPTTPTPSPATTPGSAPTTMPTPGAAPAVAPMASTNAPLLSVPTPTPATSSPAPEAPAPATNK